jgi:dihydrofolate reductase
MAAVLNPGKLPGGLDFVGHAIVSTDGMISAGDGSMPSRLRNDADWRRFQQALDASAVVVVGRLGHRAHRNPGRRRLVLTSGVGQPMLDLDDARALLFNPAQATLADALAALGIATGTIAVTGGTDVFAAFLPFYTTFDLAEVDGFVLPDGRPCFRDGHPRSVLAKAGLRPAATETLDAGAGVRLTRWTR